MLRKATSLISFAILIVGILTLSLVGLPENAALGQSDVPGSMASRWAGLYKIQESIVSAQDQLSSKAGSLQSSIEYRINKLNELLPTATSNPAATGSSDGGGTFSSECVIATAAYGSNLVPQVQFLRDFRDNQIKSTAAGASFMQAFNLWYYSFSPSVAEYERGQPWLQQSVRIAIVPLLSILQLSENGYSLIDGEAGALTAGFVASAVIGMVYFGPIAIVALSRKSSIMNKVILYSLTIAGGSLAMISIGVFFEGLSGILMFATTLFVLGNLAAGATVVAKLYYHLLVISRKKGWTLRRSSKWLPSFSSRLSTIILVIVAVLFSTATVTAFVSGQTDTDQTLSKEQIETQLRRLDEMKTYVEETRRAAALSRTMAESKELTGRVADLVTQYGMKGSTMENKTFFDGLQFASDSYQTMANRVSSTDVSERHGLLRQTLSNAIVQLSLSSGDYVSAWTCQTCSEQEEIEYLLASEQEQYAAYYNFETVYTMINDDALQVDNFSIEIDQMPGNL